MQVDDLVHFTLREWSRLSYSVGEAEVERAKAQLKASILLHPFSRFLTLPGI